MGDHTDNYNLYLPSIGEQGWGNLINNNFVAIDQLLPPGAVMAFATINVPTGWLLCDGRAVSRTTYAKLFAAVGTLHGTGDGSTTFNLPNFGGRMILGSSSTYTQAQTGGAETVTLTLAQMAPHNHSGSISSSGAHTHNLTTTMQGDQNQNTVNMSTTRPGTTTSGLVASSGSHTHTVSMTNSGSGQAHNNMPPYIVEKICIKY